MKEEVIYFIYFDLLLKINYESYNLKAFFCFETFFLFINREVKLLKIDEFENYKLQSIDLIGFGNIWELYFQATNLKVSKKAGELLAKIFRFVGENEKIFEELKKYFIDETMNCIKTSYIEIQNKSDNQSIKLIFFFFSKIIF